MSYHSQLNEVAAEKRNIECDGIDRQIVRVKKQLDTEDNLLNALNDFLDFNGDHLMTELQFHYAFATIYRSRLRNAARLDELRKRADKEEKELDKRAEERLNKLKGKNK